MSPIPHNGKPDFRYGVADRLSPCVRRVICNNPGSFTFTGTGTYLLGSGEVAVIDPGPADDAHIEALLLATRGETISHILVTHTHMDHSPGCKLLQQHCDAPTYAFGPHATVRDNGGFGADMEFSPDILLADEQWLGIGDLSVQALHTPGHAANHLSFYLAQENALFCGDVVMGWSTTIVSPPDGNMRDYMASLQRLVQREDAVYYPTHGAPVENPAVYVRALIRHREERENQVLACLAERECSIEDMLPMIYKDIDPALFPAAARSLFATVECLAEQDRITATEIAVDSVYRLV